MRLITYKPQVSQLADFVSFWGRQYSYKLEHLYIDNIGLPLTSDRVHQLYKWKNGSKLATPKWQSIENNYVAQIAKVKALPLTNDAASFLKEFPSGGAIWRIFWLHCWQPNRFPIYDQHVHRAMSFIENQKIEEIPEKDSDKVQAYLVRYLPFHHRFQGIDQRSVDKALWSYGKFIKAYRFPVQ